MPHTPELPQGVRPGDVLIVVHDFQARGADELTLRRGDKVELLELDEGFGDGWYLGKHVADNRTGLFPGVYTTTVPKIGVRHSANTSSNPTVASKPRRNSEPPSSPKALEATPDPVSPSSNDDVTPQASRQVSGIDFKPSVAEATESNAAARSPQQQGPHTSPSAPMSPTVQRSISEAMVSRRSGGEDSPVMNETLSVIDEHITNFNTPRHSVVAQEPRITNDSGSEYSSHLEHRMSYIPGAETDEEEEAVLSESDVRSWDQHQTAQHLRELGIDPKHCEIFEEQEITGDVLLEMDQEFIYMKEFNFGVMGRRLKTWHIIKTFQEEIKGIKRPRQSSSTFSGRDGSEEFERSQSRTGGSFLPRIPSLTESHTRSPRQSRSSSSAKPPTGVTASISSTLSSNTSPVSPLNQTAGFESSSRPSAASIRQINYPRPHSSLDSSPISQNTKTMFKPASATSRDKKSSFDRGWTMARGQQATNSRPGTIGPPGDSTRQQAFGAHATNDSDSSIAVDSADLDRGYFSGGEIDTRKSRNVLKKRDSAGRSYSHSRQSSAADDLIPVRAKRHSRFGSADSIRELVPYKSSSKIHQGASLKGRLGDSSLHSKETHGVQSHAPTVTNLEEGKTSSPSHNIFSALSPLYSKTDGDGSGRSSPLPSAHLKNVAPKVRRAMGLRAISDAVTGTEKASASSPTSSSPLKDPQKSPTRTNSSTPSGASKSFEIQSSDSSSKAVEGAFALVTMPKPSTARTKSKKDTSAYMRGLEKKTPQEQMIGCDYSGWMKKKSSNLMTTWKPRLFVLRGRRLSYYYSENDTEERGLIDISSHRVFRADQDTITSLHATITGAKASPTSPSNSTTAISSGGTDTVSDIPKSSSGDGPFIFKLVPPKAGLSRAVQFTKPAIHFFQVDNIQQGRLWMAALMKATIERDLNLPVRTTNKQKTISLKQARATNQRPPALMSSEGNDNNLVSEENDKTSNGEVVKGLNIETPKANGDSSNAGAELKQLEAGDTGPTELLPEAMLNPKQETGPQG
ncbi:hypothetical protein AJ79_07711 [Helicocarpus griseus UAMH5409]|uniref:Polarized growth protein Boi2 n=1 Tax=Helicocarpus griseus UAMH5409 TaxID=1447875 RepID=A0A2B7WZQ8_9EURO|nr:hypothetical protein AJ79_07711 [Helicocarpus griseus UAMH5409]